MSYTTWNKHLHWLIIIDSTCGDYAGYRIKIGNDIYVFKKNTQCPTCAEMYLYKNNNLIMLIEGNTINLIECSIFIHNDEQNDKMVNDYLSWLDSSIERNFCYSLNNYFIDI